MFQLILPTFRLLVMAPSLARDRKRRQGMFAPELSEASKKLSEMYVQLNTRLATALIDHDWPAQVEARPMGSGHVKAFVGEEVPVRMQ